MSIEQLDDIVGHLDGALVVVTADDGNERAGCLLGFHSQASIKPRRYAVWLSKANFTYRVALHAEYLALHVIDRSQHELAELFGGSTGDDIDKFEQCQWQPGPHGVPVLEGPAAVLVGRRVGIFDVDTDHTCFVLDPVEVTLAPDFSDRTPFRLSDATDIEPGHPAEERPAPSRAEST